MFGTILLQTAARRRGVTATSAATNCRRLYSSVNPTNVADRVARVLAAKTEANLTYDQLANKLGVTNTYAAQLLLGQAKLTPHTATKLQETLPTISDDDLKAMQTDAFL